MCMGGMDYYIHVHVVREHVGGYANTCAYHIYHIHINIHIHISYIYIYLHKYIYAYEFVGLFYLFERKCLNLKPGPYNRKATLFSFLDTAKGKSIPSDAVTFELKATYV